MSAPPSRAPGSAHRATNLSGAQLGIILTSLVVGFLAGPSLGVLLAEGLGLTGMSQVAATGIATTAAFVIAIFTQMVFGELVPKNWAIAEPMRVSRLVVHPQRIFMLLLGWLVRILNSAANAVLKLLGFTPTEGVAGFVAGSGREGLLDEDEITLLTGALHFEHLTAEDMSIPAEQLRTVLRAATVAGLEQICAQTGFSRFPVRAGDGMLVRYVHTEDLPGVPAERRHAPLPVEAVRRLGTVGADAKLRQVMRSMQERNAHPVLVEGRGRDGRGRLRDRAGGRPGGARRRDPRHHQRHPVTGALERGLTVPGTPRPDRCRSGQVSGSALRCRGSRCPHPGQAITEVNR